MFFSPKGISQSFSRLLSYALLFMTPGLSLALAPDSVWVEAVWVEAESDKNSIRFARYENDKWALFNEPLYVSDNSLTSPALGSNSRGQKILIWTEQNKAKTILMSMNGEPTPADELSWSEPSVFSKHGIENFAASIVYDRNDEAWVFWSATTGTYSDIVMQRYNGDYWDRPLQVNQENAVPDDLPRAEVTEHGTIRVEWRSFDLETGLPIPQEKEFLPDSKGIPLANLKLVDNIDSRAIPLPPNMPPYSPALLHFPTNAMVQSARIEFAR